MSEVSEVLKRMVIRFLFLLMPAVMLLFCITYYIGELMISIGLRRYVFMPGVVALCLSWKLFDYMFFDDLEKLKARHRGRGGGQG